MYCTNCGARIPDDVDFCTNCGQPVQRQVDETPKQALDSDAVPETSGESRSTTRGRAIGLVIAAVALVGIALVVVLVMSQASPTNTVGGTSGTGGQSTTDASGGSTDGSSTAGIEIDASASTPIGNLVNGGYVCEDDDNVYYTTPVRGADEWFTNGIVRQPKDGSASQTIYTTSAIDPVVYHLNVTSGRVIFTEVGNGSTLVRSVGADGSDPQTLATADDSSLVQVYEGRVYYVSGGTLRVMDPDGGNAQDIMGVSGQLWRVANDKVVHFASRGATSVSLADLDGSGDHVLISTNVASNNEAITNVIPTEQGTYDVLVGLADEGGGYSAYEVDGDGNQLSGLVAEAEGGAHINRLNPTRDGLVLLYDHTAPPVGSSDTAIPTDEEVAFEREGSGSYSTLYHTSDASISLLAPTYVDGYVYFACVRSGNNVLLRIPVTGGSVETVA